MSHATNGLKVSMHMLDVRLRTETVDGHELVVHQQILSYLSAISVINNDLHSVLKSSVLLWFVARQVHIACVVEVAANGCGMLHGFQFTAVTKLFYLNLFD